MITQDSIIIEKPLTEVYKVASDIENSHRYLPGYKPSKVIKTENDQIIIEREAQIKGRVMKWKSLAKFNKNKSIEFEQIEGKLKGMKIVWLFKYVPRGTELTIIHKFKIKIPIFGWLLSYFIAKPRIDNLTRRVLIGLKNYTESFKRQVENNE